ncbi:MAG: hypothetical protein IKW63_05555 [Elusimicrobiaceae bacterium]|nr:hypothetical protein [Elusimicrobiaceae bacterium]
MNKKMKLAVSCGLPLLLIAVGVGMWLSPSETDGTNTKEKVRSLFAQNPAAPEVGDDVYDETSMLDQKPYRPRFSANSDAPSTKIRTNPFRYSRGHIPVSGHKVSTSTAAKPVVPSTATAQAVAAALPPAQQGAAQVSAPVNNASIPQTVAGQNPAATAVGSGQQPSAGANEKNTSQAGTAVPAAASALGMPSQEVLNMFPQMKDPKYQKQLKETDQLLKNLFRALEKAAFSPQQSKRLQNIAKYSKAGTGRLGGGSHGRSSEAKAAANTISSAGEAIAQSMEQNYGKEAADKVRQATGQYAQVVSQAMAIDNEEQRRAALAAAQAAYELQVRRTQMEAIFKQALQAHTDKYKQELTDTFGAETAAAAMGLLEQYPQDIFDASCSTEDPFKALAEVERMFQANLATLVNERHLEELDVNQRLQTVQENVLKSNIDGLSVQLEEQKAAGNKISMEAITDEYLEQLRVDTNARNTEIINNILETDLKDKTPEQKAAWKEQAEKILSAMTEEIVTTRKNMPPDQSDQYLAMIAQISDKANNALGQIVLPETQEDIDRREQRQAYLDSIGEMYGPEAGAQVRTLLLKLEKGLISPEEFHQQEQAVLEANMHVFEAHKAKIQKNREKQISQGCRRYENQIFQSQAFTQYPTKWRDVIKRMIRPEVARMETDLIALSRNEELTEEEYLAQERIIQERTANRINGIFEHVAQEYQERVK